MRLRTRLIRAALAFAVGLAAAAIGGFFVAWVGDWSIGNGLIAMIAVFLVSVPGLWSVGIFEDTPMFSNLFAGAFALAAAVLAIVFGVALRHATREQALHDRGVVETAVVAAEHLGCQRNYDDGGCYADYFYTLHGTAGQVIRPDLNAGDHRLQVGTHITVLFDPRGQLPPTTDTRTSAHAAWITTAASGSAAVACLVVMAVTVGITYPKAP